MLSHYEVFLKSKQIEYRLRNNTILQVNVRVQISNMRLHMFVMINAIINMTRFSSQLCILMKGAGDKGILDTS